MFLTFFFPRAGIKGVKLTKCSVRLYVNSCHLQYFVYLFGNQLWLENVTRCSYARLSVFPFSIVLVAFLVR